MTMLEKTLLLTLATICLLKECNGKKTSEVDPILGKLIPSQAIPSLLQVEGEPDFLVLPTKKQIREFELETNPRGKRQIDFGGTFDLEAMRKAQKRELAIMRHFVTGTFGTTSEIKPYLPAALKGIDITEQKSDRYVSIFTIKKKYFNDVFYRAFVEKMKNLKISKPWMTDPDEVYTILKDCVSREKDQSLTQTGTRDKNFIMAHIRCDGKDSDKLAVAFAAYSGNLKIQGNQATLARVKKGLKPGDMFKYYKSNLFTHVKDEYPDKVLDSQMKCTGSHNLKVGQLKVNRTKLWKCGLDEEGAPKQICGCMLSKTRGLSQGGTWYNNGTRKFECSRGTDGNCNPRFLGCVTETGAIMKRGEKWMDSTGQTILECQDPHPIPRKCVTQNGSHVNAGVEWNHDSVRWKCLISQKAPRTAQLKAISCVAQNGTLFQPGPALVSLASWFRLPCVNCAKSFKDDTQQTFVDRCRNAAMKDFGFCRTPNGLVMNAYEWQEKGFLMRCKVTPKGENFEMGRSLVGCSNWEGKRIQSGGEWVRKVSPRFITKCFANYTHGRHLTTGCLNNAKMRVADGEEWNEGVKINQCTITNNGSKARIHTVACMDEDKKRHPLNTDIVLYSSGLVINCDQQPTRFILHLSCQGNDKKRYKHGQKWTETAYYVFNKPFLTKGFVCRASLKIRGQQGKLLEYCKFNEGSVTLKAGCFKKSKQTIWFCGKHSGVENFTQGRMLYLISQKYRAC